MDRPGGLFPTQQHQNSTTVRQCLMSALQMQQHPQPQQPQPQPQTTSEQDDVGDNQYERLASTSKTIVTSDDEVSNGFVKDGKRLPYVFEANETGQF